VPFGGSDGLVCLSRRDKYCHNGCMALAHQQRSRWLTQRNIAACLRLCNPLLRHDAAGETSELLVWLSRICRVALTAVVGARPLSPPE
jgi:hypothetical protein